MVPKRISSGLEQEPSACFEIAYSAQPLTTLETLRAEFLQLVQAFLQTPTREAAIKAKQLAKQIMELAQQTPGFDRPLFVFRELVAQLTEGLAVIEISC